MALHADYSPGLDWSRGDLRSISEFNYSLISVSDELRKAEDLRVAAILLNAFLGFGIGSFVQGDIKSGVLQLVYQLVGNVSLGVGYSLISVFPDSLDLVSVGAVGVLLGSAIRIATFIVGLVNPNRYVKSLKKKLKKNLKTTYNFKKYNNSLIDKTVAYNFTLANF